MAFRKRKPGVVVDDAKLRLDGMKGIDTANLITVNYGSVAQPLTQTDMTAQITLIEDDISDYNQMLENATVMLNKIQQAEKKLKVMYTRVLKGAIAQFGPDSSEVEVLGGTRTSERKKPVKKNTTPPVA